MKKTTCCDFEYSGENHNPVFDGKCRSCGKKVENKNPQFKALPDGLKIKTSEVHGQGLFTEVDIPAETNLGRSNLQYRKFYLFRFALGAFYNHSDNPNCIKVKKFTGALPVYHLVTLRDIKAGEELTVEYTFYKVG